MPVYNGSAFFKKAIDSIINQTFTDFELIIINDGSTDNSEDIIHSYSDSRIRYVKNEKNIGLIETLNKGLELANGNYIARMDADDISAINRLEYQINFLKSNPEVGVLSSKLIMIDEKDCEIGYWQDDFETVTTKEIKEKLPKINCIGHPTIMFRKELVHKFKYNKSFKHSEDWGLWLDMLSEGITIAKLDETLLKYRVHQNSVTINQNKINVQKKILRFKRNYLLFKFKKNKFKATDKKVLKYYLIDVLKYYLPKIYWFIIKILQTDFLQLYKQNKVFNNLFHCFPEKTNSVLFFPFCHIGGAEIVHLEITKAVAFTNPIVMFTGHSMNKALYGEFKENAIVLEIDQLLIWPFLRNKVKRRITETCTKRDSIQLFSSNSKFFYDLLQFKPVKTKAYDLIHAFMHSHEDSAEKWSLPVVDKLNARVVINLKTKSDLYKQYTDCNVAEMLLDNIVYIANYTELQPKSSKSFDSIIRIVYVGRGTAEKRVHVLADIAKYFKTSNIPVEFHFVGDVGSSIPVDLHPYCILHGEIKDKNELSKIYNSSHILAMASTREGFPMVIMEGMMHGLITVSTNVGGISEHVNSDNGVLINEIEPSIFVQRFKNEIINLLADRTKMKKMSDNAYIYAVTNFNKKLFNEAYSKLFGK